MSYPNQHYHYAVVQPPSNQRTQQQDLSELKRQFPTVDKVVLESVYAEVNQNFDRARQALMEISVPTQASRPLDSSSISPQAKMNFLKVVFDKLNPLFIQQILEKYRWSVEAALDDLLTTEDQRSKLEEEQKRKEEAIRRQREEEERQRLRMVCRLLCIDNALTDLEK